MPSFLHFIKGLSNTRSPLLCVFCLLIGPELRDRLRRGRRQLGAEAEDHLPGKQPGAAQQGPQTGRSLSPAHLTDRRNHRRRLYVSRFKLQMFIVLNIGPLALALACG